MKKILLLAFVFGMLGFGVGCDDKKKSNPPTYGQGPTQGAELGGTGTLPQAPGSGGTGGKTNK